MVVSYEILIGGYGAEIKWNKLTQNNMNIGIIKINLV